LLARRQQQVVRKWLRHAENLSGIEDRVVHICEPEIGRNLGDEEEMRSARDTMNCQESGDEFLYFHLGDEMGSSRDLIDCQEGKNEIPNFQVSKGEEMSSEVSSYQQGMLTEEDQRSFLVIGGIQIFLPNNPVESSTSVSHEEIMQQESKKEAMGPNDFKFNCVCDAGVAEERQPAKTFKEDDKEQTLMFSPVEKEEHSDEFLTQWKQELNMLEDWLNNLEPEKDCQDAVMQRETGCQHEEQLEEVEYMPTEELTEANLSEEEAESSSLVRLQN
jgi:hypothetical protein